MSLADRWAATLSDLHHQGRYRSLQIPKGVDFTSNDYLGYAGGRGPFQGGNREQGIGNRERGRGGDRERGRQSDRCFVPTAPPCAGESARSGRASRLLSGHSTKWNDVESALARWHGAEATLIMNSGYVANEGLLSTIITANDWVASDQCNHASIIDGLRLAKAERFLFRHNDLNHLQDGLKNAVMKRRPDRELFVVTESLFSMEGDTAPLRDMVELAQRFHAHVIVDEAHATGCFGPHGSGLVDALGLRQHVLATMHTGGKALGVMGAYICGSHQLKEMLINKCRHLIFTTALPAFLAEDWLTMLPFVCEDDSGRQQLRDKARYFRTLLESHNLTTAGGHYIVPILLGDDTRALSVARQLQEQGFDIRPIRPPTVPPGTSRLRIALHADHDDETLSRLATALHLARG